MNSQMKKEREREKESSLNHTASASPWGKVFGTHVSSLPDFSVFIIEGGMARVIDKGLNTHFFTVFQNDICELALFRTEDEHSQVS